MCSFTESTHPRKGTETNAPHGFLLIVKESTHPRKGTETVWLRRMDISRRKSQLTPARGRKLAYIFTTICYFTKESTHPREGTETPLSALLFHASIGINSPPQGDEQYIIKDSDAH